MLKIQTLVFLSILTTVSPLISAQTSGDVNFGARVRALHMAEKTLRDLNLHSSRPEIFSERLESLERNIELFDSFEKELQAFLSLDMRNQSDRKAIERISRDIEKSADQLMAFVGGKADNSREGPVSGTLCVIVEELSKTIIRIRPRLDQVMQMTQKNLIDVKIQQGLIKDLSTVRALSRRLRN